MAEPRGVAELVTVQEYLSTPYKPARDYLDGVLRPKPMPTWKHSRAQAAVCTLIERLYPEFAPGPELTVRIHESKFLVPDIAVQRRDRIQQPYPTAPVHLCVEVVSPEDRMSALIQERKGPGAQAATSHSHAFTRCAPRLRFARLEEKSEDYLDWGVVTVWIIDPEKRQAWHYSRTAGLHEIPNTGELVAHPIRLSLSELFAALQ